MPELLGLSLYSDANLQEYYRLEDNTGKNGNTLTNVNSVAFNAAKFGNGANTGTSDADKALTIANRLGYTGGAYAISLWIKMNTDVSAGLTVQNIFELKDGTTSDTSLFLSYNWNSGSPNLHVSRLKHGVAEQAFDPAIGAMGTTLFHHIVVTYDATTLRAYFDGVDVGNVAASGTGSVAGDKFSLFEDRTAGNGSALAIIDDVAMFNRNLTAAEVLLIYQDAVAGGLIYNTF